MGIEVHGRAGRHPWGYVKPTEAAWELLEETVGRVVGDMLTPASEAYRARGWAPCPSPPQGPGPRLPAARGQGLGEHGEPDRAEGRHPR